MTLAVAPFAGAWIEIGIIITVTLDGGSLPSRERGLKYTCKNRCRFIKSRSLRGSVD